MKIMSLLSCVVLALLALGYSFYEARSEEANPRTPAAVWAECRRLESKIQTADDGIRQIENEARQVQEAIANYEYVRTQNARTLQRLKRWADAE